MEQRISWREVQLATLIKLTILRMALALFVFILVVNQKLVWSLLVFLLGAFSDFLDGFLARKQGMVTVEGQILDPIADRIFILSACLAVYMSPLGISIPLWTLLFLVSQDVFIGLFALITILRQGLQAYHISLPGKLATFVQYLFVSLILLINILEISADISPLIAVLVVTSLISGFHHVWMFMKAWRQSS